MGIVEEKVAELKKYRPKLTKQEDFEDFWQLAIEELFPGETGSASWKINVESQKILEEYKVRFDLELEEYPYPLKHIKVYKATIEASDGTILHGWYLSPVEAGSDNKVPALVRFHGYSSNKGKICELLLWALQGYAILAMDVRGQCGDTPDPREYTSGSFSGWMTLGLDSPMEYYYRQVYLDSIQTIEALVRRPEVDSTKIGLFGNSQGAALAIISSALITRFKDRVGGITARIAGINAGVPFLTDMQRAYKEHTDGPWAEFDWYFRMHDPLHEKEDEIFTYLSYFDAMNFAPWVNSPVLLAVGLKDTVCPPPTSFALYNHLAGKKEIMVYPDYGHESIDSHVDKQISFFASLLL
ncbi:MAG: acetylxylan esterase [Gracilibacter sp. BRH_c7a]|nr:MAG: acetylxylan esterase [Gracilibacter sp. BRH_c7a]